MLTNDILDKLVPLSLAPNPTPMIAPLQPSQDTTPDQIAAYYKPSPIPVTRHSPLPAAANAAIGATAAATAQQVVDANVGKLGVSSVSLDVPGTIFTPAEQTATAAPLLLAFSLLPEPANTIFAGPANGNGILDGAIGLGGTSANAVNIALTATAAQEVAFFFVATQGAGPGTPNPGAGWTLVPSLGTFTTIYYQYFPTIGAINISAPAFGTPWGAILAFLGTDGNPPALAQPAVQGFTVLTPTTAAPFASNNTAGNTILVAVSCE